MAEIDRTDQPRGFCGVVRGEDDLVATAGALRLPRDAEADGPFLRVPDGSWSTIVVEGLAEGLGNLEALCEELAHRLAPDGRLLIDARCAQSPAELLVVLEGRPNSLDPFGSVRFPERPVSAERLIDAVSATGLLVTDMLEIPHAERFDARFVRSMIDSGVMATAYAGGSPPERLWLVAGSAPVTAGSALIGPGDPAQVASTRDAVSRALPEDWEIIECDDGPEPTALNRGVARARGDVVWLLRAGAEPTVALAEALLSGIALGPTGPAGREVDFSGTMFARRDLLRAGPFDETWRSAAIAYEDWGLRLESRGLRVEPATETLLGPPPAADASESETRALMARWAGIAAADVELDPVVGGLSEPPWAGRSPRVSLCMMVRDEERFLDDCLRLAAPAVDEIIVVDTGSTDRTIDIARSHGAQVIEEEWSHDFAHHRNTALRSATGDWILVLDADEMLEPGSVAAIRRAVENPRVAGYHCRFTNFYGDHRTLGVTMVRLFRNLSGLEWINRIHEQITPSLLARGRADRLVLGTADGVHVTHHGYTDEVMDARGKLARNERLFEQQLAEHPDDVYSLYKYGDFLRRCPGRDADARRVLEQTFELIVEHYAGCPRGLPYASEVAALCALEFAREEEWSRADEILEFALRHFMVTPNLHYIAAGLALRRGREDEAIAHYRQCLRYRGQTLVVPIQDGITGHVSLTGMAQAYLQKGDRTIARRLLEQSIALDPDHDVTAMVLSRLHLESGDPQRAISVLSDYLRRNPDSAGACQQLTMLLAQLGHPEEARRLGSRAVDLLEASASGIEANRLRKALATLG